MKRRGFLALLGLAPAIIRNAAPKEEHSFKALNAILSDPRYTFTNDADTGFYMVGSGLGISTYDQSKKA